MNHSNPRHLPTMDDGNDPSGQSPRQDACNWAGLPAPSAKEGLTGLPVELLINILDHVDVRPHGINLVRTCRKFSCDFRRACHERQFKDAELGPILLAWACARGLRELVELGLSYCGHAINDLQDSSFNCYGYDLDEDIYPGPWKPALIERQDQYVLPPPDLAPLHLAVLTENLEMTKLLLDRGADVERVDSCGRTPLCFAVDDRMVSLLLDAGANPLHWVDRHDDFNPMVAYLTGPLAWRAREPEPVPSPAAFRRLLEAARDRSADWRETVNKRMHLWPHPERTLLEIAAGKGPSYTRSLLEMGADPNQLQAEYSFVGVPPLQAAAQCLDSADALEVARLLVAHGARVNDVDSYNGWTGGCSPRTTPIWNRKYDLVRWLVEEAGADPNLETSIKDNCEVTGSWFPLHSAIKDGDIPMIELLISLGADARRAVTAPLMAALLGIGGRQDTLWWWSYQLPHDQGLLARMARVLVQNGADLYQTTQRTTYYSRDTALLVGHETRDGALVPEVLSYHPFWINYDRENGGVNTSRLEYEPTLGRLVCHVHSATDIDGGLVGGPSLSSWVYDRLSRDDSDYYTLWYHTHYKVWTSLHTAMVHGTRHSVEAILSCGADPLCGFRLASQMKNTPLGALIRTHTFSHVRCCSRGHRPPWHDTSRTHCPNYRRATPAPVGILGPFRGEEWGRVHLLLGRCGPGATARFPPGLMAEFLGQAVARLRKAGALARRLREFAALTGRGGGVAGLRDLVRRPGYWWALPGRRADLYARPWDPEAAAPRRADHAHYPAAPGPTRPVDRWPAWEGGREVRENLLRAARMVVRLAGGRLGPVDSKTLEHPWYTIRWWEHPIHGRAPERARHAPLPLKDYRNAFYYLFEEGGSQAERSRVRSQPLPDDEYASCFDLLYEEEADRWEENEL